MAKNPKRDPPKHGDDPAYVEQWAKGLILAIGKTKARVILKEYERLARNRKVTAGDRATASLRAKILRKHTNEGIDEGMEFRANQSIIEGGSNLGK